ncbi:MAG: alpha/beta fold hydrolase [Dehalococcoidia bacterium]|nr:alpha/beta fold hydrolase [Dehalococcoidia bacterium]
MPLIELVRVETADGVRLDGSLRRPDPGAPASLAIDAVIMHHGVGGNFYASPYFGQVQESLAAQGCAVLRVNNRGHDIAYSTPRGRLGAAFETVDDCRLDWRAWIDFAETQGYRRVALWGHSLGALKTLYYLSTEAGPRVVCAVTASPPLFSYTDYAAKAGAERFKAFVERARSLVDAGDPEAIFPADIPTSVLLSARTYLDKYGPGERYNLLGHLPRIQTPLLVTIGSEEGLGPQSSDWFPFGGLAPRVEALAANQTNLTFQLIAGADHAYAGRVEQLWHLALAWLSRIAVPAGS